ncbi:MAG: class I SAM-dependent methyltransferase [Aliishimia sp.]
MSLSIAGYTADAASLMSEYDRIDPAVLYQHVAEFMPKAGERVLDVGAGTGRDAAFWGAMGCDVTAVEPVAALWTHPELPFIEDKLPHLDKIQALQSSFDVIILTGVFHHLPPDARETAIPVLASLLKPAGRLVMSLRHGPSPRGRPAFPFDQKSEEKITANHGLKKNFQKSTPSIGPANIAAGVTWTWLVLGKTKN